MLKNVSYHFSFAAELKARVLGPSDLYVKSGSEITLICKLQQGPHDLGTIYWYKGKLCKVQYVAFSFFACSIKLIHSSYLNMHLPYVLMMKTSHSTGNDMIQTRLHENDINSDDMNRISVDTDSSDGLTSR